MRRGRILIFLLLILIVGLAVAYVAIRAVLQAQTPRPVAPTTVEVFVASQNIPQGAKITEDVLGTITVPSDKVSTVEFTADEKGQLVNKIAKFPLEQGVVITSPMVTDSSQAVAIAGPQWAALIPPGMTAASIPASRLSLSAYGINDGAHVNVNACFLFVDVDPSFQSITPNNTAVVTATGFPKDALPVLTLTVGGTAGPQGRLELDPSLQQPFYYVPSEAQRPRVVCQTILQDVVVMKLGNFPLTLTSTGAEAAQPQSQAQQQTAQAAVPAPDIITLIVSPQDAVTLSYMVYTNAQISMTLRNPSDQSRLATEAATLQFLLSQYNIPVPAKLPYSLQPRIETLTAPTLPNDAPKSTP
jgi:Flp pilus assembly protein CpaB